MKTTIKKLALIMAITASAGKVAAGAASTNTFVNPCQPFGTIVSIGNTYGCYSFSVTNAGDNDPNGYYTWNFGDGTNMNGKHVYHCYSPVQSSTVYSVMLSYIGPQLCGVLPTQTTYTLLLNPPSSSSCITTAPTIYQASKSVTVGTGIGIPEMMHSFKYGDGTSSTNNNTHLYNNCNNYVIEIKSWDMNAPQDICYSYAAVNMDCSTTKTITSINEKHNDIKTSVYPNPATDKITIKSEKVINGIKLVDLTGKEIMNEPAVNKNVLEINLSSFEKGIYILQIKGAGDQISYRRFLKQ